MVSEGGKKWDHVVGRGAGVQNASRLRKVAVVGSSERVYSDLAMLKPTVTAV